MSRKYVIDCSDRSVKCELTVFRFLKFVSSVYKFSFYSFRIIIVFHPCTETFAGCIIDVAACGIAENNNRYPVDHIAVFLLIGDKFIFDSFKFVISIAGSEYFFCVIGVDGQFRKIKSCRSYGIVIF